MSSATHRDVGERIFLSCGSVVPASLLPVFRFCLDHSDQPLSVARVAEECGIRRRALEYRFRKAGLAPPAACLMRCRLLLAVHDLEHGPDSIEHVALEHGFGTAGALRKAISRHLGVRPGSLRRPGAFMEGMIGFPHALRHGMEPSH